MVKKHQLIEVEIEKIEFPNLGIGHFENKKVIVKQALPGEVIKARVFKFKNGIHAKTAEIIRHSPYEIVPECQLFGQCGGCSYQNISYDDEIEFKKNMVMDLLKDIQVEEFEFFGIVFAPDQRYYRNKMEYTFGDEEKDGDICLGMRKKGAYYEVVNVKDCKIVHKDFGKILQATLDFFKNTSETFFHRIKQTGALRNLVIRKGYFTDEILVNLVTTSQMKSDLNIYAKHILDLELSGRVKGILHTINDSVADAVKMDSMHILYGQDYYMEKLLGLDFKISAFSFFQTNSRGAELLYTTVKEFAGDAFDKTIFDLYCGTGTIAQIMSETAKKVIGVELVEEAVMAAKENAERNGINNCEFIAGDVLKIVGELNERPDIIILDPPREGIHPKAIRKITGFNAETIVYVSCKPTSLASDLEIIIGSGYAVRKVKCHDMFSRTGHVETVVKLCKADKNGGNIE